MLNSIKVTNFHSIGSAQELSLQVSKKDILDSSAILIGKDKGLNLVAGLVGHNASGKTNMLKALSFLGWLTNNSYDSSLDEIPVDEHKFWKNTPTKFELLFSDAGVDYKYSIELDSEKIISESFGKKIVRDFTNIFKYVRSGDDWRFVSSSEFKINPNDLKRFKERKRVSVLSSLIQLGYIANISFFKNFISNVDRRGLLGAGLADNLNKLLEFFGQLNNDKLLLESVLAFVKDVDFGIDNFGFSEIKRVGSDDDSSKRQMLETVHKSINGEFKLNFFEESNGTQQGIYLLGRLLPVLQNGGLAVIDEIEAGLHPHVVKKIINLFEKSETNKKNAQLIFSTHQHMLLNDRTKTQIFLVEKDNESFESEVYRLDDVEDVRNDENYFQKYITGVYGATPKIYFF